MVHWISAYFFIQSFLTCILQNYARKYHYPIDTIDFEFHFLDTLDDYSLSQSKIDNQQSRPIEGEGNLIYGLYMEGGAWDPFTRQLKESEHKVLLTHAPIIYLKPARTNTIALDKQLHYYHCPLYNTLSRKGSLNSTGISNNFILYVKMPSSLPPAHWVKRSLALFC